MFTPASKGSPVWYFWTGTVSPTADSQALLFNIQKKYQHQDSKRDGELQTWVNTLWNTSQSNLLVLVSLELSSSNPPCDSRAVNRNQHTNSDLFDLNMNQFLEGKGGEQNPNWYYRLSKQEHFSTYCWLCNLATKAACYSSTITALFHAPTSPKFQWWY